MSIILDLNRADIPSNPNPSGDDWDDDDDVCGVLTPIAIDDSRIVSISSGGFELAEDSNPPWDSGAVYGVGDRVYLNHVVYESVRDANTNKDPSQAANQYNASGVPTWWIQVGPTNRFAMFDSLVSTQTIAANPLTLVLQPGAFNSIALFGLDADDLSIVVRSAPGGGVIYSYNAPLEGSAPADYYDYFFAPFEPRTQLIVTDIEAYTASEVTITIRGGSTVKVGMVALGDMRPLGLPLRGASVEPVDYSLVTTDAFGNTTIVKRNNATSLAIQAKVSIEDANTVLDTVKALLGQPVVVSGSAENMYEALTVFGLISARMQYDSYPDPTININVKGLI